MFVFVLVVFDVVVLHQCFLLFFFFFFFFKYVNVLFFHLHILFIFRTHLKFIYQFSVFLFK